MDKLRIAVFLNENYDPKIGGGFSYYQMLIKKINNFNFDDTIDVIFLSKSQIDSTHFNKKVVQIPYSNFISKNWTLKLKIIKKIFSIPVLKYLKISQKINNKVSNKINDNVIDFLKANKIDLIYYAVPDFYPLNYPFIATHWDIGHKTMYAFPEVSSNKKFEKREFYHQITLQKAFAIFTESEQSKKELIYFERINEQRIFVLPLFAGKVIELNVNQSDQQAILNKWNIEKNNFYFYPAQFWAHKNHFGLIMAFKIVLKKHQNLKLVLCGSDKGNLNYIKQIVAQNNLQNNVVFTGFISDEEVFSFYKNAIALVMPTYLGPTNMPLLEAYHLGCPVLCSNLEGHIEQMKNNAIYFDPKDYHDIANKMLSTFIIEKNNNIDKEKFEIETLLNRNFLELYNVRKTFGYEF